MEANDPRARSVQRIILAEDDDDMRGFLVRALAKAGYDVVSFGNGLEADGGAAEEEPFTLLLTDIVMPEMDGMELARKATELDPDLKIMFITGFAGGRPQSRQSGTEGRQDFRPSRSICATWSIRWNVCLRLEASEAPGCLHRVRADIEAPPKRGGRVAQRYEHCVDIAGVTGSIPVAPTIFFLHNVEVVGVQVRELHVFDPDRTERALNYHVVAGLEALIQVLAKLTHSTASSQITSGVPAPATKSSIVLFPERPPVPEKSKDCRHPDRRQVCRRRRPQ